MMRGDDQETLQVEFTVPGKPAPFIRATGREHNIARRGRSSKDAAIRRYLDYKSSVQQYAMVAMVGKECMSGFVDVVLDVYLERPHKKRWDTANVYKACEDALNRIVYHDDKQVRNFRTHVHELLSDQEHVKIQVVKVLDPPWLQ